MCVFVRVRVCVRVHACMHGRENSSDKHVYVSMCVLCTCVCECVYLYVYMCVCV